jgi:hypothetical protein
MRFKLDEFVGPLGDLEPHERVFVVDGRDRTIYASPRIAGDPAYFFGALNVMADCSDRKNAKVKVFWDKELCEFLIPMEFIVAGTHEAGVAANQEIIGRMQIFCDEVDNLVKLYLRAHRGEHGHQA